MEKRLKDIIEVPKVKLVIELDDTDNDPDGILSTFVLTDQICENLNLIFNKITEEKGCGIFLKGNFGSGKSHFLSYLYLILKKENTLAINSLKKINEIRKKDVAVYKISLVKYPSSQSLENILLSVIDYQGEILDREQLFNRLLKRPCVIIIDELSEFLQSKPSRSDFYEDIRFLQFLGEYSLNTPLWIIASLQEWIEETGHISSNIFNRIKDRYPVRIDITSSHIEDIIDKRIVLKKEGA